MVALELCLLGIAIAAGAHIVSGVADRRARALYKALVGPQDARAGDDEAGGDDDPWQALRPAVGGWGCLLVLSEFLRGLGILIALGAGLYLFFAR